MLRTSPCAAYGTAGPVTGGSRGRRDGLADPDHLVLEDDQVIRVGKGLIPYMKIYSRAIGWSV